jgi:hypothetical protein
MGVRLLGLTLSGLGGEDQPALVGEQLAFELAPERRM